MVSRHEWLLVAGILTGACSTPPPQDMPAPTATSPSQTSGCRTSSGVYLTSDEEEITYYKDILPILESSLDGVAHKCTSCHADYLLPHRVARVEEVERMIASMESGRMPPKGFDRVRPEYIQKLKVWRLTGFKIGNKADHKPLQPTSGSAKSGNNAGGDDSSSCN